MEDKELQATQEAVNWDTFRFPEPPDSWKDTLHASLKKSRGAQRAPEKEGREEEEPKLVPDDEPRRARGMGPGVRAPRQARQKENPPTTTPGKRRHGVWFSDPVLSAPREAQEEQRPDWATPIQFVTTWHLDIGRMILVHPPRRQKINLARIGNHARLVALCQLMLKEPNALDFQALWLAVDQACKTAFAMSLPQLLSERPARLVWATGYDGDDLEDMDD